MLSHGCWEGAPTIGSLGIGMDALTSISSALTSPILARADCVLSWVSCTPSGTGKNRKLPRLSGKRRRKQQQKPSGKRMRKRQQKRQQKPSGKRRRKRQQKPSGKRMSKQQKPSGKRMSKQQQKPSGKRMRKLPLRHSS